MTSGSSQTGWWQRHLLREIVSIGMVSAIIAVFIGAVQRHEHLSDVLRSDQHYCTEALVALGADVGKRAYYARLVLQGDDANLAGQDIVDSDIAVTSSWTLVVSECVSFNLLDDTSDLYKSQSLAFDASLTKLDRDSIGPDTESQLVAAINWARYAIKYVDGVSLNGTWIATSGREFPVIQYNFGDDFDSR